jgi:hypothetical protein
MFAVKSNHIFMRQRAICANPRIGLRLSLNKSENSSALQALFLPFHDPHLRVALERCPAFLDPGCHGAGRPGPIRRRTLPEIKAKSKARLDLTGTDVLVFSGNGTELRIPYARISIVEYGQKVSRRYAAAILVSPVLLLSKSHQHFVTLGYQDDGGKQQAIVFRVEKGDIRSVLAGLEARSGRRIEYQDDDARKAGQ